MHAQMKLQEKLHDENGAAILEAFCRPATTHPTHTRGIPKLSPALIRNARFWNHKKFQWVSILPGLGADCCVNVPRNQQLEAIECCQSDPANVLLHESSLPLLVKILFELLALQCRFDDVRQLH